MYLLVIILLTANGMQAPAVFRTATEAECIKALPLARDVAEANSTHGYVAFCVAVSGRVM